jgi:hypothetical protein
MEPRHLLDTTQDDDVRAAAKVREANGTLLRKRVGDGER